MKYCTHCGAELIDEAAICTKCGCWINNRPAAAIQNKAKLNVCALIGFILAMASIFFLINFMGLLALAGMIVSIVGLAQVSHNSEQKGKGFAIAGVSVGACLFLLGIFMWVLILIP